MWSGHKGTTQKVRYMKTPKGRRISSRGTGRIASCQWDRPCYTFPHECVGVPLRPKNKEGTRPLCTAVVRDGTHTWPSACFGLSSLPFHAISSPWDWLTCLCPPTFSSKQALAERILLRSGFFLRPVATSGADRLGGWGSYQVQFLILNVSGDFRRVLIGGKSRRCDR